MIFSVLLYFIGACVQIISFVLQQENIITNQSKTKYLFFSLLFAAAADLLMAKVIPENIKILKYVILFHAAGAIIGYIMFWIISIIG